MNLALHRRRFFIAMTITLVTLVLAMLAMVGAFVFHLTWMIWVFGAAVLTGFGSHGWLIMGVMREKSAP